VVGIVIVTHSRELAESVIDLAGQMLRKKVPLAAAGGVDDPEYPFGTDVSKIIKAVESVYSDDGVLVLMDMGSALLSAETALEFLTEKQKNRVLLCEAPLVEGAVAAAVSSEGGGTLDEVSREARGALQSKGEQLKAEPSALSDSDMAGDVAKIRVTVQNQFGIHARPAAALVSTASRFQSTVMVRNASRESGAVNARSINQVSLLGVQQGDEIVLSASGPDADVALGELKTLVENGFGESERRIELGTHSARDSDVSRKGGLSGVAASPGIALAPCKLFKPHVHALPPREPREPEEEWANLTAAIDAVKLELRGMRDRVAARGEASIFDAHLLILDDEELRRSVHSNVYTGKMNAEQSWAASLEELLKSYGHLDSFYQRERGRDLEDLRGQVLAMLTGGQSRTLEVDDEAIVIAADLTPSDIALFDTAKIIGLCTAYGGPTSHSVILALALGIPAVVGLGPEVLRVSEGRLVAIDGKEGTVWVDPEDPDSFRSKRARWLKSRTGPSNTVRKGVSTVDGRKIRIVANISSLMEAERAVQLGADGVGVLRTEFLFMRRLNAPSEEEQTEMYRSIADRIGTGPLIIRTLDAGGDKPLAYVPMEEEANPFLGVRGLRLSLEHPELFMVQLRAILRASQGRNLGILLPMVSSADEIREAREYLAQAQRELKNENVPFEDGVKLGIMVEVPAAALIAERLAGEVDFMSIGTNDLSQYVMSADRGSERVSSLCDALHPAILRLIQLTTQACHGSGKWAGVCGEVAGDRSALPVLLGLGVDELSMNPYSIPMIKEAVSQLDLHEASTLAAEALQLSDPRQVRRLVSQRLGAAFK
jgi:phosphocarrier protein FPr